VTGLRSPAALAGGRGSRLGGATRGGLSDDGSAGGAIAMLDEVHEHIEHLGLERPQRAGHAELVERSIEFVLLKAINHGVTFIRTDTD